MYYFSILLFIFLLYLDFIYFYFGCRATWFGIANNLVVVVVFIHVLCLYLQFILHLKCGNDCMYQIIPFFNICLSTLVFYGNILMTLICFWWLQHWMSFSIVLPLLYYIVVIVSSTMPLSNDNKHNFRLQCTLLFYFVVFVLPNHVLLQWLFLWWYFIHEKNIWACKG